MLRKFNYVKLLHAALSRAGYRFTELSAYVARDLILIKLHGSVNWARVITTPCPGIGQLQKGVSCLLGNREFPHACAITKINFMAEEYPPPRCTNHASSPPYDSG